MKGKLLKILSIFVVALALALSFKFIKTRNEKKDGETVKIEENIKSGESVEVDKKADVKSVEPKISDLPKVAKESESGGYKEEFIIKSEEEFKKILEDSKPQIIMFGTKNCVYCAQMRPYFEKFAEKYKDKINMMYLDAEDLANVARQYPIQGVPAIMYRMGGGSAYMPNEDLKANSFYPFSKKGAKTIDLMMSFGLLKEDVFEKVIEDVIANVK